MKTHHKELYPSVIVSLTLGGMLLTNFPGLSQGLGLGEFMPIGAGDSFYWERPSPYNQNSSGVTVPDCNNPFLGDVWSGVNALSVEKIHVTALGTGSVGNFKVLEFPENAGAASSLPVACDQYSKSANRAGHLTFESKAGYNYLFVLDSTTSGAIAGTILWRVGYDSVWFDDAVPAGSLTSALGGDSWANWVTTPVTSPVPTPFSGTKAISSAGTGTHVLAFKLPTGQGWQVNTGDVLFAYIYINPSNLPSNIQIQYWTDVAGWNHRAHLGASTPPYSPSTALALQLPPSGQWVRLEIPAADVGLEGKLVRGIAFVMAGGHAYWDKAGKLSF